MPETQGQTEPVKVWPPDTGNVTLLSRISLKCQVGKAQDVTDKQIRNRHFGMAMQRNFHHNPSN